MSSIEIVAIKIRKYRAENRLSREALAGAIGISVRHLNDIENMDCEIKTDTIDAISTATGIVFMMCTEEELKYYDLKKRAGVPIWKRANDTE